MTSNFWKLTLSISGLLFCLPTASQAIAHPGHGEAEVLHHGGWDFAASWLIIFAAGVVGLVWLRRRLAASSTSQQ